MKKILFKHLKIALLSLFPAILLSQSTTKWEETFNSAQLPAEWQAINADNGGNMLSLKPSVLVDDVTMVLPQSGNYFWYGNSENASLTGKINEWLISPQISVIYAGDSLYFWAGAKDGDFKDSLRVLVSTTGSEIEDFTHLLGYFKVDGPVGSWNKYSFDLSAFDSTDIYFAINYFISDGGSGGRNSDHVWIDHFVISGESSDLNEPPISFNLKSPQNFTWLHPTNDNTIHFRWESSSNTDNDPLTYNLTILDVFPPIEAEIVDDTTFAFDWIDVIEYYSIFRWTVNVTDGKSTIFCPDTFFFATPPKENLAPISFSLVYPEQQQLISFTDSTRFSWHPAFDPNLDDLLYKLQITGNGVDTLFTGIIDTSVNISCNDFLAENSSYSWTVFADDSLLETQSNETWQIKTPSATFVDKPGSGLPLKMELKQNYPNPFNPTTIIEYSLAKDGFVDLSVFNLLGHKIATLVNGHQQA